MLRKKQFIEILKEQWRLVIDRLQCFCSTGDKEALHDMRVAIKKIKAVVWLADKHNKEKGMRKCMLPIHLIFRHAGNIRNAQLSVKYCLEHPLVYQKLALQQQRAIQTTFKSFTSNQQLYVEQIKQAAACLESNCKSIPNKIAKTIVEKRTKRIIREFGSAATFLPEHFHEYRKKIKSIVHIHKIFLAHTNQKMLKHHNIWDKLQDAIGTWLDLVLFEDQLHNMKIAQKKIDPIELRVQQHLVTIQQLSRNLVKLYAGNKLD